MSRTHALMVAATMFDAMVAGTGLDRVFVQMPSWTRLGPQAWAAYSRHADLGNGLILYPTLAIGGCVLSIAAAVSCAREGRGAQGGAVPAYVAAVLTLCGLLLTIKAAPLMLSLRTVGSDSLALQSAFDGFDRWGRWRSVVQFGAFGANLWSVAVFGRYRR
jgi:hypothetical protein